MLHSQSSLHNAHNLEDVINTVIWEGVFGNPDLSPLLMSLKGGGGRVKPEFSTMSLNMWFFYFEVVPYASKISSQQQHTTTNTTECP